jgi:protein-tyrosine-phosphatase
MWYVISMMILFVCTANIVRSYMAEAILKGKLKKMGKDDIEVGSAGLKDMHGAPADPVAQEILEDNGYPLPGHHSRFLDQDQVSRADWIVVMEDRHRLSLLETYPEAQEKIRLLKPFSREFDGVKMDIEDPYRQPTYRYRQSFAEIYLALDGLIKCI